MIIKYGDKYTWTMKEHQWKDVCVKARNGVEPRDEREVELYRISVDCEVK